MDVNARDKPGHDGNLISCLDRTDSIVRDDAEAQ